MLVCKVCDRFLKNLTFQWSATKFCPHASLRSVLHLRANGGLCEADGAAGLRCLHKSTNAVAATLGDVTAVAAHNVPCSLSFSLRVQPLYLLIDLVAEANCRRVLISVLCASFWLCVLVRHLSSKVPARTTTEFSSNVGQDLGRSTFRTQAYVSRSTGRICRAVGGRRWRVFGSLKSNVVH